MVTTKVLLDEIKMRAEYSSPGVRGSPTLLLKLGSNYENGKSKPTEAVPHNGKGFAIRQA